MSESAPAVESVVLEILSPAPKGFPGLDAAIAKLSQVNRAITSIESRLANLGGNVKLGGVEKLSGQMTDLGTTAAAAGKAGTTALNDQGAAAAKTAAAIAKLNEQLVQQRANLQKIKSDQSQFAKLDAAQKKSPGDRSASWWKRVNSEFEKDAPWKGSPTWKKSGVSVSLSNSPRNVVSDMVGSLSHDPADPSHKKVYLENILSHDKGKGNAKSVLDRLTKIADEEGIDMRLMPKPTGKGGMNKKQLDAWYRKFGFETMGEPGSQYLERPAMQSAPAAAPALALKLQAAQLKSEIEKTEAAIASHKTTGIPGAKGSGVQPELGTTSGPAPTTIQSGGKTVIMEIAGYDVRATLAPGTKVSLVLGPDQIVGGVAAVEKAKAGAGGGGAGSGSGGGGSGGAASGDFIGPRSPDGRLIERTTGDGYLQEKHRLDAANPTIRTTTTSGETTTIRTKEDLAKVSDDLAKAEKAREEHITKNQIANAYKVGAAEKKQAEDAEKAEKARQDFITANEIANAKKAAAEQAKLSAADEKARLDFAQKRAAMDEKARIDKEKAVSGVSGLDAKNSASDKKASDQLAESRASQFEKLRALREKDAANVQNLAERERRANLALQNQQVKGAAEVHRVRTEADLKTQKLQTIRQIDPKASKDEVSAMKAFAERERLLGELQLHTGMAAQLTGAPQMDAQKRVNTTTNALANQEARIAEMEAGRSEKVRAEAAKQTAATEKASEAAFESGQKQAAAQRKSADAAVVKANQDRVAAEIKAADDAAKLHEAGLKRNRAAAISAIPADATRQQANVIAAQANVARQQGMVTHHAGVMTTQAGLAGTPAYNPAVHMKATQGYSAALQGAATATQQLNTAQAALANTASHVGKNFAQNLMHITQWAMGAGALYGTLGVFKSAVTSSIQMEYQMARLGQVFRGEQSEVKGLTNDVLMLAAANGRSSSEAMESAIQWSRLGLNRLQVTEAVRVSLIAANVAEITAAEATDHLSSLMRVYDLNVRSLSGALGMLNATSNTFNVTNKDLLEGITRTSSAAKQAGLSLAELIGFIGAGVGATGQTGTNIGNSMKSMIGAFSAPDKQKLMREQFKFEPTNANGDLKDMSDLMAQLYVHFQKLNEAQKQSFIFNIAGKNQASRVTALLDNYIKAQTLAIQALLGMNSAEKENEKIKETAKAQLQGLITEFERFSISAAKAGSFGVNSLTIFSEVLMALKNGLSAFNGGPGAALLVLMAAIAAKSLVMMAQMGSAGRGGSFLAASAAGVANALRDVRAAMIQSLATMPGWVRGAAGVTVSATGAATAVRGMSRAFAVAAAVAVVQFGLVIAAIAGLSAGFNWVMEKIGASSDSANKAIDEFSDSAERARGAAEAAALQVKLFDTTLKALKANPNQADRAGIIANVVEGLHPYTSEDMADENKKRAKDALRDAARRELNDANAIGNSAQRNAAFERHFADAAVLASDERVKAKQRERAATQAAMEAAIEEGRRLKNSWRGGSGVWGWFSNKDDQRKNAEKVEELNTKRRKRYHEDSDEQEASRDAYRSRNEKHLTFLEVQKRLITDIQNLWNEMPGDSYDSRLNKEIGANAQILRTLEARLVVERALAETQGAPRVAALDAQSDYNRRMSNALQQQISGGLTGDTSGPMEFLGFNPFAPEGVQKTRDLAAKATNRGGGSVDDRDQIEAARAMLPLLEKWWDLQGKINDAEAESARIRSTPGFQATDARITDLEASAREHRRTQAALENSQNLTRTREQIKIGADFGTMESGSFRTGYSDTDALVNQFKLTGRASERHAMRAAELSAEADMASRFVGSGVASPSLPRARGRLSNQGGGLEPGERSAQNRFLAGGSPLDAELTMAANLARIERLRTGSVIERGMALSQGNDLLKIATELNQKQADLEKAKVQAAKDYNKALALSGPAEMLKRMALSKLTNNFSKVNGGQFLAFDEGSKKMIDDRMRPGWELNENKAALKKLGINGAEDFEKFKAKMEQWMSILRNGLGNAVQPQIDASAAAAASIGRLGSAADAAAAALLRLAGTAGTAGARGTAPASAPAQNPYQYDGYTVMPDGTAGPID